MRGEEEEPQADDEDDGETDVEGRGEPIGLVDVSWTTDDRGTPVVEVTIRNDYGEETSVDVSVNLYEDDRRLADVWLYYSEIPDGVEASDDRGLVGEDAELLERITHWTIEIEVFSLTDEYEATYEFDGPIVPDEEIDVEDAEMLTGDEEEGEADDDEEPDGEVLDDEEEEEEDADSEPIEVTDVVWRLDDFGSVEIEVTVRNDTGEEISIEVTVRLFEDDTLLDDVDLLYSDVPDGVETSEDRSLLDAEEETLERVTHWTMAVEEFTFLDGYEALYEFEGPVVLDEAVDLEEAEVVNEEEKEKEKEKEGEAGA